MNLRKGFRITTWVLSVIAFIIWIVGWWIDDGCNLIYWEFPLAAFASFAGIWALYWIILWLVRLFYKASNRQKRIRVVWLGILIFILIGLFPPTDRNNYGFMGSYSEFEFLFETSSKDIAFGKLLIIWLAVAAITGGLLYTLKDKKLKDN